MKRNPTGLTPLFKVAKRPRRRSIYCRWRSSRRPQSKYAQSIREGDLFLVAGAALQSVHEGFRPFSGRARCGRFGGRMAAAWRPHWRR